MQICSSSIAAKNLSLVIHFKEGYATPLIRLILPGSTNWIGFKAFLIGHTKTTSPPPLGGMPLLVT